LGSEGGKAVPSGSQKISEISTKVSQAIASLKNNAAADPKEDKESVKNP